MRRPLAAERESGVTPPPYLPQPWGGGEYVVEGGDADKTAHVSINVTSSGPKLAQPGRIGGGPAPLTTPDTLGRTGQGYPGIEPGGAYDNGMSTPGQPSVAYRRIHHAGLSQDTTPNGVGGGSSGGNDNSVVAWSPAGPSRGRQLGHLLAQPAGNQHQGVGAVPAVFARRQVG